MPPVGEATDDIAPTGVSGFQQSMTSSARDSTRRHVVVAVLRSGALRRVLLAFFLFNTAELATWVALLVWAFDKYGASGAGLIALIQLIPAAIVAPLGSVLGDRMARNRALALGYGLQALFMLITGLALATGASFAVVSICGAAAASAVTLTRPVHNAILPDIAWGPNELIAANSVSSAIQGIAFFVGPATSGVLLALWGPDAVLFVMATASLVAGALTVGVHVRRRQQSEIVESFLRSAGDGLRALRTDRPAGLLVAMVGAQFVILGLMDIMIVVLALDLLALPQAGAGYLTSVTGIGEILGAAATVVLVGRRRLGPAIAFGVFAVGVPIALIGASESAWWAVVMLGAFGAGTAFFDVGARTLLQRSVAAGVLSRIFGIQEGLMMAGLALGSALAPLFVLVLGERGAFVAAGVLLPALLLISWSAIRLLDARALLPGEGFALLEALPMFAPLPQRILEELSWSLSGVELPAGREVIREGDVGDRFFVVKSGELLVTQEGRELRTLGPGEQFGEIALLRDIPRTATVTTTTAAVLETLDREDFLAAVTGTPRVHAAAHDVVEGHLSPGDDELPD